MVGQGVLRECLIDPGVDAVLAIGRSAAGLQHPKLREMIQPDLYHYPGVQSQLEGYDACFFCLGVSSAGMSEEQYEKLTYTLTLAAAETLVRANPGMTFVYVSGTGTDSSGKGRVMWARIKGRTENALLRLPFKAAYMFRPGVIQPVHGARSRTTVYRLAYTILGPVIPLLRWLFPRYILTTQEVGQAMIQVARQGWPRKVLEIGDIHDCAAAYRASVAEAKC